MRITQELFESFSAALAELERQADAVDRIQAMATTDTEEQS